MRQRKWAQTPAQTLMLYAIRKWWLQLQNNLHSADKIVSEGGRVTWPRSTHNLWQFDIFTPDSTRENLPLSCVSIKISDAGMRWEYKRNRKPFIFNLTLADDIHRIVHAHWRQICFTLWNAMNRFRCQDSLALREYAKFCVKSKLNWAISVAQAWKVDACGCWIFLRHLVCHRHNLQILFFVMTTPWQM